MTLLRGVISGVGPINSHARVVEDIGRAIVTGKYAVGEVLPGDAQLGERFGVSRTVLREAMKTLGAKGLVVARARVGTRVNERRAWNVLDADVLVWLVQAGGDPDMMRHVFEMRLALEPVAARLAAENAGPDDVRLLFEIADRLNERHTNESFALVDLDLHLAVLEASGNPLMHAAGNLIEAALAVIFERSSPVADQELASSVAATHRAIVEAIAAGDGAAAEDAMRTVIMVGWNRI